MARTKQQHIEPRCTLEEFEAVMPFFGFEEASKERVRRILVDGVPPRVIVEETGVFPSHIHRQYTKVLKKIEERRAGIESPPAPRGRPPRKAEAKPAAPVLAPAAEVLVPPGWEATYLVAPKDFVERVRKELNELLAAGV